MSSNVDAIIVCYQSEFWLDRCLDSLAKQTLKVRSVYLVDNGEMDPKYVLSRTDLDLKYLRLDYNLNYGGGNNVGFQRAVANGADYVLAINPDIWMEDDALEKIVAASKSNPNFGIISGLQLLYESDDWSKWAKVYLKANKGIIECEWLEGSLLLMPREALARLGGFDPIYPMYFEDLDLCRRARMAGMRCCVVKEARYHHYSNASFEDEMNPRRLARIDPAQLTYLLTDSRYGWLRNCGSALRWFIRKLYQWITGKRPGFGSALPVIFRLLLTQRTELKANWCRRRSGDLAIPELDLAALIKLELGSK